MIIEWDHIAVEFMTVTAPLVLFMWKNRMEARKQIESRHQQNQEMLEELCEERKYFQLHEHVERSGPLTVEGIRKKNGR